MPTPRRHAHPAARQAAYRHRLAEARRKEQEGKGLPPLPTVATLPGHRRWQALLRQADLLLRTVQEEMQDYFHERSETWQQGERGEAFLESLQAVQEAQDTAEELLR